MHLSPTTVFDTSLADDELYGIALSMDMALQVFEYFKASPLFRWSDANNDCEDRANAICILLDSWGISNEKAWVFSGYFRKKEGALVNRWNYHVAAALPVTVENRIDYYVIDPATSPYLITIENWALQITESGTSYHFTKSGLVYIFPAGAIKKDNWHKRNVRNYRWTMQGLSGINGVSPHGKALLAFDKQRAKKAEKAFTHLKNNKPVFIR